MGINKLYGGKVMFKINKRFLLLIAGIIWMTSGIMIMRTGYLEFENIDNIFVAISGATIVFLIFYLFIFKNIVKKNDKRVKEMFENKQYFWKCFDLKQYVIIACMMTFGIVLRKYNLVQKSFIAFFYTGLGFALFSCGTRFIARFIRFFEK